MIGTILLLLRGSTMTVLFLVAAVTTLFDVLSRDAEPDARTPSTLVSDLSSMRNPPPPATDPPAAMRIALFDPERRPETIAGSIDDLRNLAAPQEVPSDVMIGGVLLTGDTRKAMLGPRGGALAWATEGTEVNGWRVSRIDSEGVVLEHDGRVLALRIADRWAARSAAGKGPEGQPGSQDTNAPPDPPSSDSFAPPDAVNATPP